MVARGRQETTAAGASRLGGEPGTVDRMMVIICVVIWLAVLGISVAAAVALIDLGTGSAPAESASSGDSSGTPWLLYTVIGVSALIIAGAVPLLVRARRSALAEPPAAARPAAPRRAVPNGLAAPARAGAEPGTEKIRALGDPDGFDPDDPPGYPGPMPARHSASVISAAALDRMWLRCSMAILIAMGAALVGVAIATYLMAVDSDTAAWTLYIVAGIITVAMPVIPWLYLRQLHTALDS